MSREVENDRSPLIRFLDAFFQERNIKWMLGTGMLILLGSSLMLVTAHWTSYTPVWKFLILLAYTAGLGAAGDVSYRQLALRKTGTGLMSLTVLLLPVTFLALRWIHADDLLTPAGLLRQAWLLGLLAADVALCVTAARRIFGLFLRGSQPTFTASYVLLCLAGAIVPGLPPTAAPLAVLVLWGIYAAGAIKVSRHVFWLTEERRLPRIFGFFPLALLGAQFVGLFAAGLAPHVPLDWMGLGLVLVAIPILATADSVARVFQARTGDLVRPYPASIVAPVVVGLILCSGGLVLSATGWPRPYALVPTAALAAVVLAAVARRTKHPAFVWGMLVALLLAYNFSPVFFREVARALVQQGAAAVKEERLPLAFYGLTYLPLLAALTAIYRPLRRRTELFAVPVRRFVIGLECLLLAVAFTSAKATFPVAMSLTALMAVQAAVLRERRLILGAVVGWIAAGYGLPAYLSGVLEVSLPPDALALSLGAAATALLAGGRWVDRFSTSLLPPGQPREFALPTCRLASLWLAVLLAPGWLLWAVDVSHGVVPWMSAALIGALLVAHTVRWSLPLLGEYTLAFLGAGAVICARTAEVPWTVIADAGVLAAVALWGLSYLLPRLPSRRVSRAFARPAYHVSFAVLTLGLVLYSLPQLVTAAALPGVRVSWLCAALATAWAFDAAHRVRRPWPAVLGYAGLLALAGALVARVLGPAAAPHWLPAAWTATALGVLAVLAVRRRPAFETTAGDRVLLPCAVGTLILVALLTLVGLTAAWQGAGLIAVAGLFAAGRLRRQRLTPLLAAMLLNWHVFPVIVAVAAPGAEWLSQVGPVTLALCAPAVALAAAVTRLAWSFASRQTDEDELVGIHRGLLGVLALGALAVAPLGQGWVLAPWQAALAAGAFAALALAEMCSACRDGNEDRAWLSLGIVAAGVGYLVAFGAIRLTGTLSLFLPLLAGFVVWAAGRWAARSPRTSTLAGPFVHAGMALPALTVLIGVVRHVVIPNPAWKGANSLALLLVAAFYFWRGLEGRRSPLLVGAAAVLNVALALLWRELDFSDPQFFMVPVGLSVLALVELLRAEIPAKFHDPLRYLGALTILVSPTFHIVGGSWAHLLSLMVASVFVTLLAIGFRVRALMYAGTAFLAADVAAMVVRGSFDSPNVLWIAGVLLGMAVLALAAYCERHRERVLQRLRLLAAELQTWQ